MDKRKLIAAIVAQLEAERGVIVAAAQSAREEATDPESKQEGQYDMRGQAAAYLAEGQARLAAELAEAIAAFRALPADPLHAGASAGLGSFVVLETAGKAQAYFLGPSRGGLEVAIEGASVLVITPASPLGRQMLGRRAGDPVPLLRPGAAACVLSVE
ncbi:MAG: GreA/GreB family elongation factor [Opitutaceae bacterium]